MTVLTESHWGTLNRNRLSRARHHGVTLTWPVARVRIPTILPPPLCSGEESPDSAELLVGYAASGRTAQHDLCRRVSGQPRTVFECPCAASVCRSSCCTVAVPGTWYPGTWGAAVLLGWIAVLVPVPQPCCPCKCVVSPPYKPSFRTATYSTRSRENLAVGTWKYGMSSGHNCHLES